MLIHVYRGRPSQESGPSYGRIRRLVAATTLALILVTSACVPSAPQRPTPVHLPASPLAGARLWVDPQSSVIRQAEASRGEGHAAAAAVTPITSQPVATWFSAQDDNPFREADRVTSAAAAEGQLPVLVAYHRPGRDCGSYSAGGSSDPQSYLSWVEQVAAGVGDRPALVVLEPDAVAQSVSGACGGRQQLLMLAEAVHVFKKQPRVRVYIDAGHPGWITDLSSLADALTASGVERADGFSLNVSNFWETTEVVDYGERLSLLLGGQTQFVVDVSRNGRGAPVAAQGIDAWCNPPEAALGENPRVVDERALAVAFLWIKQPGVSDGDCRPGEPKAGVYWPDYARRLIDQRP
jgi:endoglucanase